MNESTDEALRMCEWEACKGKAETVTVSEEICGYRDGPVEKLEKRTFSISEQPIVCTDAEDDVSSDLLKTLSGSEDSELFGAELSVSFLGSSERIISGSDMGIIKIWDKETPLQANILKGHYNGWVSTITLAASPDKKRIISGGEDERVKVWNLETGEVLILSALGRPVHSVTFRPDGKGVAFGLADGTIRLWNWFSKAEAQKLHVLSGHSKWVYATKFSPDGNRLATGSGDSSVRVWTLKDGTGPADVSVLEIPGIKVYSLSYAANGRDLAFGLSDGRVCLWDVENGDVRTIEPDTNAVWSVACHPEKQVLAMGLSDGSVGLWNWEEDQIKRLYGHESTVWSVAFSPNGDALVTGSADETVKMWDLKNLD